MNDFNVRSLMALPAPKFIETAYITLLGREVDEDGYAHYLAKLTSGVGRGRILADLAASKESRALRPSLSGLKALLRKERLMRLPLLGNVICLMRRGHGKSTLQRLNGLDEQMGLLQLAGEASATKASGSTSRFSLGADQSPHMPQPASLIPADYQYVRALVLAMIARPRMPIRQALSVNTYQDPVRDFYDILESLPKDDRGSAMLIEAPEIALPDGLSLPPRSAAILAMWG